jgi:hypothetical protein
LYLELDGRFLERTASRTQFNLQATPTLALTQGPRQNITDGTRVQPLQRYTWLTPFWQSSSTGVNRARNEPRVYPTQRLLLSYVKLKTCGHVAKIIQMSSHNSYELSFV